MKQNLLKKNILFWLTIIFTPLLLQSCALNGVPHHDNPPSVSRKNTPARLTFDQAYEEHMYVYPFQEAIFGTPNRGFYSFKPYRAWNKQKVENKKNDPFTKITPSLFSQAIYTDIQYWLIRETKRRIKEDYFAPYGKQAKKEHTFHPNLYGGVKGLGTIFPIKDNDIDSFVTFTAFLENKTTLTKQKKRTLYLTCFPELTFFKLKMTIHNPHHFMHLEDSCARRLEEYKVPYYGIPVKHFTATKIVETFVDENPAFDSGLYHYLFALPPFTNQSYIYKNHFPSLQAPFTAKYLEHVSLDHRYVLDKELSFKKATTLAHVYKAMNAVGFTENVAGDGHLLGLYGDYDLSFAANNHVKMSEGTTEYLLFDDCTRSTEIIPIAYEEFAHFEYNCYQGYNPSSKRKQYGKTFTVEEALVTINVFNEADTILAHYTENPPEYSMYAEIIQNPKYFNLTPKEKIDEYMKYRDTPANVTKKTVTERLISKQLHYGFLSWVQVEGHKVYGCVEYYGMLYKYNITPMVKYLIKSIVKRGSATPAFVTMMGTRGNTKTLDLFPDLKKEYEDNWEKHRKNKSKNNLFKRYLSQH